MNQAGFDSGAFGRLFLDRDGQDLLMFSNSVFEMMNLFSQAIFRVGLDAQPGLHYFHTYNISMKFLCPTNSGCKGIKHYIGSASQEAF